VSYQSEIVMGERYRDSQSKFEGHAVCVAFYQHGCERVTLKGMNKNGEIVEYGFDSPEVELVSTGEKIKAPSKKPGGPHGRTPMSRR
jgi:hypothetical protein